MGHYFLDTQYYLGSLVILRNKKCIDTCIDNTEQNRKVNPVCIIT